MLENLICEYRRYFTIICYIVHFITLSIFLNDMATAKCTDKLQEGTGDVLSVQREEVSPGVGIGNGSPCCKQSGCSVQGYGTKIQ